MTASFGAVIFDLDGVLVDSEIWWDEVRQAFAARRGKPWTTDDRAAVMGHNSRGWAQVMRDRLGLDESVDAIVDEVVDGMIERFEAQGAPLIPGAVEAVRRVGAALPLGIASSAHPRVIAAALESAGLRDAFRSISASDEVPHGKPAPDVYLLAAERMGTPPADCLVVEDSLNGVLAARAAGMVVALVPNVAVPPAPGADAAASVVLERISELDPAAIRAAIPADPRARRASAESRPVQPIRRTLRYWLTRATSTLLVRALLRVRVVGREHLPTTPYLLCFSHESWADPFVLMAVLPWRPRLSFFGPMEEDMTQGGRNRLMRWAGNAIPYRPGKNDLLEATRRVQAVFAGGGVVAIAGEGRIHARESEVLPLSEGAAFFALRSGVPIVPVAINGMTWFSIGSRVRVRIGAPIPTTGRPTRENIDDTTNRTWDALHALVGGFPERSRPGRFGAWLTELFNDWPEGGRPSG